MASLMRTHQLADTTCLPLRDGERLLQSEFHRRYLTVPEGIHFELIQGVVYMNSAAMKVPHNDYSRELITQAALYSRRTPGVHSGAGASVILNDLNEPEPDSFLRLQPEYGGTSRNTEADGPYIQGAPELIIEIADTTLYRDLHQKKDAYKQAGVKEYIVVCVEHCEVKWFQWPAGEQPIPPDSILKSTTFPGFWLDVEALFRLDGLRLEQVLFLGMATTEYLSFRDGLEKTKEQHA